MSKVTGENDDGLFIGVDVGSYSVRAGLFDVEGHLLATRSNEITVSNPQPGYYEQSSEEIWSAVCQSVKQLFDHPSDQIITRPVTSARGTSAGEADKVSVRITH
jgi:sugar (pentulose or hexulose) kinase